jgi:hypothetical protein
MTPGSGLVGASVGQNIRMRPFFMTISPLRLERASALELFTGRYATSSYTGMLSSVLAKDGINDFKIPVYQFDLAVCNACNGYDQDEEEYGKDSEAFGGSSLSKLA